MEALAQPNRQIDFLYPCGHILETVAGFIIQTNVEQVSYSFYSTIASILSHNNINNNINNKKGYKDNHGILRF